jgi:hypothetical protein
VDDGKFDPVGSATGLVNVRSWQNAGELEVKIARDPGRLSLANIDGPDLDVRALTPGGSQSRLKPFLQVWLTVQNRFETRSFIARCSHHCCLDPVEWKQPFPSARRLYFCFDGVNDCMDRLERVARARSDQPFGRVINRARDPRLEFARLSEDIHVSASPDELR